MKVIEKNIIEALKHGKALKAENTTVMFEDTASGFIRADVHLYGTRIATITFNRQRAADGTMLPRECELTFGGYPTATTRSRINAVAFWAAGCMPASIRGNNVQFDMNTVIVLHGSRDSVVVGVKPELIVKTHGLPPGYSIVHSARATITFRDDKSLWRERKGYINQIADDTADDRKTSLHGTEVANMPGLFEIEIEGDDPVDVRARAEQVVELLRAIPNVTVE